MNHADNKSVQVQGIVCSLAAGVCWGSMAVAAQALFAGGASIGAMELVTLRLLIAGSVLILFSGAQAFAPVRRLIDVRDVFLAGLITFGGQFCFMKSITYSGAGVATIILTTVPFWVAFWFAVVERRMPTLRQIVCFVLAFVGVTLIVTHGEFSSLNLEVLGVSWALGSAVLSAGYSIQPRRILKTVPVTPFVGWAMVSGGLSSSLMVPPWTIHVEMSAHNLMLLFVIIIIGTALAFFLYMRAIHLINPVVVGLLGSSEPLCAYVLSVLLLGTVVTGAEMLGAVMVLAAVFFVTETGFRLRRRGLRR